MVDAYICHTIDQGNKDFCAFTRGRDKSGPYRIRYM